MEIVVLHTDQKLLTNIEFLKTKLIGSYEVVQLADFEAEFPKLNPDVVIFFHSLGITEPNQFEIVKKIKKQKGTCVHGDSKKRTLAGGCFLPRRR